MEDILISTPIARGRKSVAFITATPLSPMRQMQPFVVLDVRINFRILGLFSL